MAMSRREPHHWIALSSQRCRERGICFADDGADRPHLQFIVRDALGDAGCCVLDRVARKLRILCRGLDFVMAESRPIKGRLSRSASAPLK